MRKKRNQERWSTYVTIWRSRSRAPLKPVCSWFARLRTSLYTYSGWLWKQNIERNRNTTQCESCGNKIAQSTACETQTPLSIEETDHNTTLCGNRTSRAIGCLQNTNKESYQGKTNWKSSGNKRTIFCDFVIPTQQSWTKRIFTTQKSWTMI